VASVIEHLPSECEALSSKPPATKKKKEQNLEGLMKGGEKESDFYPFHFRGVLTVFMAEGSYEKVKRFWGKN
jgi:hypothetical protein